MTPSVRHLVFASMMCASVGGGAAHAGALVDARAFRDLFAGLLAPVHGPDAVRKLVLFPTAPLLQAPTGARTAAEFLTRVTEGMRKIDPATLYRAGLGVPLRPVAKADVLSRLRRGSGVLDRLTLIVLPGVFGEFIQNPAFEELFSRKTSAFRGHFEARVRAVKALAAKDARYRWMLSDPSYSLEALAPVPTPIEELVSVSSLDDADGTPLVNLVLFNTKLLSLESAGDIGEKATIFSRRLEKFFALVGLPTNLGFVGHSRGAIVGLDMLAKARAAKTQPAWLERVRAFVSLAGVLYGSELADNALNVAGRSPEPRVTTRLRALRRYGDELAEIPAGARLLARLRVQKDNAVGVARVVGVFVKTLFAKNGELHGFEEAASTLRNLIRGLEQIDVSQPLSLLKTLFEGALHIDRARKEYNLNVRKAKVFVTALLTAVEQLPTGARFRWWQSHIVPSKRVRYYSVAATMAQSSAGDPVSTMLATSVFSYNPRLLDYTLLLAGYGSYVAISGVRINDSQMAAHRVRFWPEAAALFNPAQPPIRATFLGVLNADHWGLATPVVNQTPLPHQINPFPRTDLVAAIAASIATDLAASK